MCDRKQLRRYASSTPNDTAGGVSNVCIAGTEDDNVNNVMLKDMKMTSHGGTVYMFQYVDNVRIESRVSKQM